MPDNTTQIPAPRVDLIEPNTGLISRQWFRYFNNVNTIVGNGTGVIGVVNGGTGVSTTPANGQLLIGDGTGYKVNTLTEGTGIGVTNGVGSITPYIKDTTVTAGSYGSASAVGTFTVNQQGQLTAAADASIAIDAAQITSGTISSSRISGSYPGITGVGTLTVGTWNASTIAITYGGTGASTAAGARTNLGLGTMATENIGVSGSFTTVDLKTVTVTNGIITSIV
jgi:hypothetical protein